MDKIILIGFRCTGKTTIGKKLAEVLNWKFLDLDVEIQKKTGKTIKEMVEEKGWEFFRNLEKKEMENLYDLKRVVIALGGGGVLHQKEMEKLKEKSLVIWLFTPEEVILQRLRQDEKTSSQRPALSNTSLEEEIRNILKEREPLYEKFSHFKIDTSENIVGKTVDKILKILQNQSRV